MQNFNLRGNALVHCLAIVKPRYLVFGDDEADTAGEIASNLKDLGIKCYHWTAGAPNAVTGATAINMNTMRSFSDGTIDKELRKTVGWDDTGMII